MSFERADITFSGAEAKQEGTTHGENILKIEVRALWEVRQMKSCDLSCLLVSPEFLPLLPQTQMGVCLNGVW